MGKSSRSTYTLDTSFLMRQVNWRFLLPGLPPQQTVCFANGLLLKAVGLITKSMVNPIKVLPNSCDLAVADNPNQETSKLAWYSLKEQGVGYFEWSTFKDSQAIARQLNHLGFKDVSLYLAIPTADQSSIATWIPLNTSSAVEYFLTTKSHSSINNFYRLFLWMQRQVFYAFPEIFLRFPWLINPGKRIPTIISIARKPDLIQLPSLFNNSFSLLEQVNLALKQITTKVESVSILMKAEETSTDQVVLFPFVDHHPTPQMVLKVILGDWENKFLEQEVKILKTLNKQFPQITNIPQVLFEGCYGGYQTQAQSYVDGIPLTKIINANNFEQIANQVTDWLILFGKQTCNHAGKNWSRNLVENMVSDLASSITTTNAPHLLKTTAKKLQNLDLAIQVVQHRDLGPWNIHLNLNEQIGVIDWSEALIEGIPGIDLIYFLTMLKLQAEQNFKPSQLGTAYAELLNPQITRGRIFIQCLERYVTELNISKSLIPQLRLLTWVIHTYLEPDHKRVSSTFFLLWQEEITIIEAFLSSS
jgi:serine/threonine protein kinase